MANHPVAAALLAASLVASQCLPSPALADNPMGYQLLSAQQAAGLPRRGGALGLNVGPGQRINDTSGMQFELLRVTGVRPNSAGAQAGLNVGDQIIAADGRVFPSVAAFAAYVGSMPPGRQINIDYMPAGGGPQQAQRVAVTVGAGGRAVPTDQNEQARTGLSTGTKIAIGVGAAALLGCYELGCFSRGKPASGAPQQPAQPQPQQLTAAVPADGPVPASTVTRCRLAARGLGLLALTVGGCTVLTAAPPSVEVQQVELRGVGLLGQSLGVVLCVTNPNDAELDFQRVMVGIDVAGAPFAEGASESPVRLPPRSSTLVPFAVVTTVQNLGPQLLGVLRTGGVAYRVHGSVTLTGASAITLPFSRSGRLDLLAAGESLLSDAAAASSTTACGASRPA